MSSTLKGPIFTAGFSFQKKKKKAPTLKSFKEFTFVEAASGFDKAVKTYLAWVNKLFAREGDAKFSNVAEFEMSKKWAKIWMYPTFNGEKAKEQKSIYAFIDPESGDMFKPATFRAPAKKARANVFDLESAKRASTPWGFGSLRGGF